MIVRRSRVCSTPSTCTLRRLNDPDMHTHNLLSTYAEGEDGQVSVIFTKQLRHDHGKVILAMGNYFRAAERYLNTQDLGVRYTETRQNGLAEIDGVPEEVLREFSQAHEEISRKTARAKDGNTSMDTATPKQRKRAWLDSRQRKDERPEDELRQEWVDRLATLGYTPEQLWEGSARRP